MTIFHFIVLFDRCLLRILDADKTNCPGLVALTYSNLFFSCVSLFGKVLVIGYIFIYFLMKGPIVHPPNIVFSYPIKLLTAEKFFKIYVLEYLF